jgi:hypothetical protein
MRPPGISVAEVAIWPVTVANQPVCFSKVPESMRLSRPAATLIATLAIVSPPGALAASRLSSTPPPWLLPAPPTKTTTAAPLPTTGSELVTESLIGAALLAAGVALRLGRAAR